MYYTRFHCASRNYLVENWGSFACQAQGIGWWEGYGGCSWRFFFAFNIFFKILLPIENRINIGGRGTRVAHLTYCDVFCPSACVVRQHLNIVSFFPATTSVVYKNLDNWESNILCHVQMLIPDNLNVCTWH